MAVVDVICARETLILGTLDIKSRPNSHIGFVIDFLSFFVFVPDAIDAFFFDF